MYLSIIYLFIYLFIYLLSIFLLMTRNERSPRCKQTKKSTVAVGLNSIAIIFKIGDDDTRKSSSKHEKSTSNAKVDGKFCNVTAPLDSLADRDNKMTRWT